MCAPLNAVIKIECIYNREFLSKWHIRCERNDTTWKELV